MTPLKTLLAQREALEQQIKAASAEQKTFALARIKELVEEYDVTLEDLQKAFGMNDKRRGPVAPKFRDPETGKTWAGRGMKPKWMMVPNAEELFAIKEA